MILDYDVMRENLRIFEDAKKIPIIRKYIDGEVKIHALNTVGLGIFGNFYEYLKNKSVDSDKPVDQIIMEGMTWRKLKAILIENTTIDRFKTYIRNRTEKQFNEILNNPDLYDRLLNGRWVRRPGKRSSGSRGERVSSLTQCQLEIINYAIFNKINVSVILIGDKWFRESIVLDKSILREIMVTEDLITSFVDVISSSKIDFKKLNVDYMISYINDNIRKRITIEVGSNIKCIKSIANFLTEGVSYSVSTSYLSGGYLNVLVTDDSGRQNTHPFSCFEDMTYHRGSVLDNLLGE